MSPTPLKTFMAAAAATLFLFTSVSAQSSLVDEDWQTDPLLANNAQLSGTDFPGWTRIDSVKYRNENQTNDVPGDGSVTDSHGYNQVLQFEGTNGAVYYDTSHAWQTTDTFLIKVEAAPMQWTGTNQRYIRPQLRLPDNTVLWTTANDATTALPTISSNVYGSVTDYPSELVFVFEVDASTFPTDNGDESDGYIGQNLRFFVGQGNTNRGMYINKVSLIANPAADNTAPTPEPLTWETVPEIVNFTGTTMTVDSAFDDAYDVEYYFENTVLNTNSGWQSSRTWTETGLAYNTLYTYRVRARDTSPNQNTQVTWSSSEDVTTLPQDLTAPSPDPLLWDTLPTVADFRSLHMSVQAASDPSGVEYKFFNVTNATDSGWQDSRFWTQKDLDPDTTYTYEVRARDKSPDQNESGTPSAQESATTPAEPEGTLYITRFQDPLFSDNQGEPDLGNWQLFRGESVKTQKATGDGVRTDTDLSVPGDNYAIQFEWDDAEIEIDVDHNWAASDTFTLTLNASPQNWSGENQRYIRPSLKQQDGTVLWAPGENMSGPEKTALPLYSAVVGSSYQDDPNLTFTFEIDASAFSSGTEGEPIALRIDSSGFRGMMIDNVHLSVSSASVSPYDTWIGGFDFSGYASPDLTTTGNPDGDLFTNLQEHAFGFDPTVSDGGGTLTLDGGASGTITQNGPPQIYEAGSGQFFLRYTRRADYVAAGIDYSSQFSPDLSTGTFTGVAGGSVVGTGTGAGSVSLEVIAIEFPHAIPSGPDVGEKARFGQVEVTQP